MTDQETTLYEVIGLAKDREFAADESPIPVDRELLAKYHRGQLDEFSKDNVSYQIAQYRDWARANAEVSLRLSVEQRVAELAEDYAEFAERGEYERALSAARQATELAGRYLDEQHPCLATALKNLGTVCYETGRYEEAREPLSQALEMLRLAVGEGHSDFADTVRILSRLPEDIGRHDWRENQPPRAAAGDARTDEWWMCTRAGDTTYHLRFRLQLSDPGKTTVTFIETKPSGPVTLLVDGEPVRMLEPFDEFAEGVVATEDVRSVREGHSVLKIRGDG